MSSLLGYGQENKNVQSNDNSKHKCHFYLSISMRLFVFMFFVPLFASGRICTIIVTVTNRFLHPNTFRCHFIFFSDVSFSFSLNSLHCQSSHFIFFFLSLFLSFSKRSDCSETELDLFLDFYLFVTSMGMNCISNIPKEPFMTFMTRTIWWRRGCVWWGIKH